MHKKGTICAKEINMKAILQFDLPDEEPGFKMATNAGAYFSALWEIDQKLRSWLKHGNQFDMVEDALQEIRDMIPGEIYE